MNEPRPRAFRKANLGQLSGTRRARSRWALACALALALAIPASPADSLRRPSRADAGAVTPHPVHSPPAIAIIMDDMGYGRRHGRAAIDLPGRLTYAVLPNAPHARDIAERLHAAGKEMMIHMPMEPVGGQDPGPGALRVSMSRDSARRAIWNALEILPRAHGLNNHMGSRATAHAPLMANVMRTLAEHTARSFYFVDSRTTAASVAGAAARAHGVRYLRRDVFIDHHRSAPRIRQQLQRLVDRALERGRAIGIAHPYRTTVAVLRDELPRIEEMGIRLVPVSELPRIDRVAQWNERRSADRPGERATSALLGGTGTGATP